MTVLPVAAFQPGVQPSAQASPALVTQANPQPKPANVAAAPKYQYVYSRRYHRWIHRRVAPGKAVKPQLSQAYIQAYLAREFARKHPKATKSPAPGAAAPTPTTVASAPHQPKAVTAPQKTAYVYSRRYHRWIRRRSTLVAAQPQLSDAYIRTYLNKHPGSKVAPAPQAKRQKMAAQPGVPTAAKPSATAPHTPGPSATSKNQAGRHYAIQLGYYTNSGLAKKFASNLTQRGLKPYLVSTSIKGPVRVMVGRYESVTDAQSAFKQMPNKISQGMIVKTTW